MANTQRRESCQYCNSSNNVCFWTYQGKEYSKCQTPGCEYNKQVKSIQYSQDVTSLLTSGSIQPILDRFLSKEICEQYDYQVADWRGKDAHIANYFNKEGKIVSQKVRLISPKSFFWNGSQENALLFGANRIPLNLDRIWVTEGEIDCLSLAQSMPEEFVVSIKSGAGDQTTSEIKKNLEYLLQFKHVIFCFDSTDCGPATTEQVCQLFPPQRAGLVSLRYKDPNDYLKQSKVKELITDCQAWKIYTPISLVQPSVELLLTPEEKGMDIPYPRLNKLIKGIKSGKLYTLMAGSGVGKSSFTKELIFHLVNNYNIKAGLAYLEEAQKTSAQSFIALDHNIALHELEEKPHLIPDEEFKLSYAKYIGNKIFLLNAAFLKLTGDELIYHLNYLIEGMGCGILVLDHITMITYDMQGENSERKDLDILMKNLRSLVHRTNVSIILVTHLKRPPMGKSYDEGREVHMSDARSSGAIEQLSDVMIALERNMLSDESNKTKIKVLKNRITGQTGYVDELSFIQNTGRLIIL